MNDLLGFYLKELREKQGLSLKEAAENIGSLSFEVIARWERGEVVPPLGLAAQIAATYGVSEDEVKEILLDAGDS